MFIIHMPVTFHVGDRAPVRINGQPATLTWRDEHTLVIDDRDAKAIVHRRIDEGVERDGRTPVLLQSFTCADSEDAGSAHGFVIIEPADTERPQ